MFRHLLNCFVFQDCHLITANLMPFKVFYQFNFSMQAVAYSN